MRPLFKNGEPGEETPTFKGSSQRGDSERGPRQAARSKVCDLPSPARWGLDLEQGLCIWVSGLVAGA